MNRILALTLAVLAIAATLPASTVAQPAETLHDGATYWQGQTLTRSQGLQPGDTAAIQRVDGQYYREHSIPESGRLKIDTSHLHPGKYRLKRQGDTLATFWIRQQSLTVTVPSWNRRNGTVQYRFTSKRADYAVSVEAKSLTADDLATIFAAEDPGRRDIDTDSEREVILHNISRNRIITGDFDRYRGRHHLYFNVTDSTAQDVRTPHVKWPAYQSTMVVNAPVVEERGDHATLELHYHGTKRARVQIGSNAVNYHLNFTAVDRNGDGRVTVVLDTSRMGVSGRVPVARGRDRIHGLTETVLGTQVDPAAYPVVLAKNGNVHDETVLDLRRGQTHGVSVHRPRAAATVSSVRDAVNASRTAAVVPGDRVAVVWQVSGVFSALDDATAAELASGVDGMTVQVVESTVDMNAGRRATLDVGAGRLFVDEAHDRVALVLNTAKLDVETGEAYDIHYNFSERGKRYQNLSASFRVVEPSVSIDPKTVTAGRTTIRGESTLTPGTTFTLLMRSADSRWKQTRTVTVRKDGTWRTHVDLRDRRGETVKLAAKEYSTEWTRITVTQQSTTTATTATATTTSQTTTTTTEQTSTPRDTTASATQPATTSATVTATTPASTTNTLSAADAGTVETADAPNPESGLLSGLWSILGWGVVIVVGSLVVVNRIAA